MNYKLTIQYDGSEFSGWQIQDGIRTVQGELTEALTLLDGNPVKLHGSGRTDAGVHAVGQTASVVLNRSFECDALINAVNANVGRDVRVIAVSNVDDEFHARYSATGKKYTYRIQNGRILSPFLYKHVLRESRPLSIELMRQAASAMEGEHDWTAFSAAQSDAVSRVRNVTKITLDIVVDHFTGSELMEISVTAKGFLRYMVRSIVGGLLAVGRSEVPVTVLTDSLETRSRHRLIATAPAHGLCLMEVFY
jgi:tRNA pseudouridine38-40 synthase